MKKYIFLITTMIFLQSLTKAQNATKGKLVFADEFNYKGLPDPAKWGYEKGFVRGNEPQYYTVNRLENCRVENGMLVIETRKETYPNAAYKPGSDNAKQQEQFAPYTSASINTKGKNSWKYGRIEVRAKVPAGKGIWPAIWMMGNDGPAKWPACGEIDIMEFLGRDSTRVHGTVHYADSTGKHRQQGEASVVGKPADGFHIYAIDWNEKQIAFYYDNLKYFVFDFKKAKYGSGQIFQQQYYLLLNTALGHEGSWAGPVDDKILPGKFYIDYVRVYQ